MDGHLVHGAHGAAGELGHLEVEPGGLACPCGLLGCLERYVSLGALLERAGVGGHDTLRVSPPFEVRAAGHGSDAALYGATCFAVSAILDDPLLVTRPS